MATQGVRVVQQILLVPFFLRAWGVDLYTDWLLLNAGVAFISIFDAGLQPYFSGLLQERRVQEDIPGYRRAARTALFDYCVVIVLALVAACTASFFIDWRNFLGVGTLSPGAADLTLVILTANILFTLPFGIAGSLYKAHGEYDRGVIFSAGNLVIQIVVPLILLTLRQPPTILAAGMLGTSFAAWLVLSADQRLRYGPLPWGLAIPNAMELRTTATQCLLFTAQPVTTWLIIQGPILILGHFGAPGATVAFATARTLVGVSRQLTLQLAYPFGFELSLLVMRGELAALRRLMDNAVMIVGIIGGLLAGFIMVVGLPIEAIWLHGRVVLEQSLIIAFALPVALTASAQTYQVVLALSNRPRLIAYASSIYAILGLAFAAGLGSYFGATGVAAGLGIGEVIAMVIYLPSRALTLIGLAGDSFQRKGLLHTALAMLLSFCIAHAAAAMIPPRSALRLIAFGGVWAAVFGICAFQFLLDRSQRKLMLKTLFPRRG